MREPALALVLAVVFSFALAGLVFEINGGSSQVVPASPREGWTFHEVHPLEGRPFVIWVNSSRNPDPNWRPNSRDIPDLQKWMDEHPCPEPTDGNPFSPNAIIWRDFTVDGGYTWYQGRMHYLMEHRHEARPLPENGVTWLDTSKKPKLETSQ